MAGAPRSVLTWPAGAPNAARNRARAPASWLSPSGPLARSAEAAPDAAAQAAQSALAHAAGARPLSEAEIYGDAQTIVVNGAALENVVAIQRPPPGMRRTLLIVFNNLAANQLFFAFGRAADNGGSSTPIAIAGNLLLDNLPSVPQNELNLFFPAAGSAFVTFINAPIIRANP